MSKDYAEAGAEADRHKPESGEVTATFKRNSFSLLLFSLVLLFFSPHTFAKLENGMAADVVIGQKDFTSNNIQTNQHGFALPVAVTSDGVRLFIAEEDNRRLLIYKTVPKKNSALADIVVGQPNFTTANWWGFSARNFLTPTGVCVTNGMLFVADSGMNRVLIWKSIPDSNFAAADIVVGQPDFTSFAQGTSQTSLRGPHGVFSDGTRLYVCDSNNSRVLIWNKIPSSNGVPADIVLGQKNFTSRTVGLSSEKFTAPLEGFSDGKVLIISASNRVLIWNSIPTRNGAPADVVIGQPDFNSDLPGTSRNKLNFAFGVYYAGKKLFVADGGNHRVLVWDSLPKINGQPADIVIGQSDFESSGFGLGPNKFTSPTRLSGDGRHLFVNDFLNIRVLVFDVASAADIELGPQFEQGKAVVGKVWWDWDGNGRQDTPLRHSEAREAGRRIPEQRDPSPPSGVQDDSEIESGIEGVRVVSDTGIYAITDEDGKYHFPYLETGQRVLKVDETTLPADSVERTADSEKGKESFYPLNAKRSTLEFTTDNPMKVTVTKGMMSKVSFGIRPHRHSEASEAGRRIPEQRDPSPPSGVQDDRTSVGARSPRPQEGGETSPLLKVSITQDAAKLGKRLGITAEIVKENIPGGAAQPAVIPAQAGIQSSGSPIKAFGDDKGEARIKFTIECNYYLFIVRSKIVLWDEDNRLIQEIELPNPVPRYWEVDVSKVVKRDSPPKTGTVPIRYQLSVYDKTGKEDRTALGELRLSDKIFPILPNNPD